MKNRKWKNRKVARPEGLEPPTPWFEAKCSIQLSYGRVTGSRKLAGIQSFVNSNPLLSQNFD